MCYAKNPKNQTIFFFSSFRLLLLLFRYVYNIETESTFHCLYYGFNFEFHFQFSGCSSSSRVKYKHISRTEILYIFLQRSNKVIVPKICYIFTDLCLCVEHVRDSTYFFFFIPRLYRIPQKWILNVIDEGKMEREKNILVPHFRNVKEAERGRRKKVREFLYLTHSNERIGWRHLSPAKWNGWMVIDLYPIPIQLCCDLMHLHIIPRMPNPISLSNTNDLRNFNIFFLCYPCLAEME